MKKIIALFLALLLALTPAFALERWQDRFAGDPYMELVRTASNWAEQHIRRANLAGIIPETMYEDWQRHRQ